MDFPVVEHMITMGTSLCWDDFLCWNFTKVNFFHRCACRSKSNDNSTSLHCLFIVLVGYTCLFVVVNQRANKQSSNSRQKQLQRSCSSVVGATSGWIIAVQELAPAQSCLTWRTRQWWWSMKKTSLLNKALLNQMSPGRNYDIQFEQRHTMMSQNGQL